MGGDAGAVLGLAGCFCSMEPLLGDDARPVGVMTWCCGGGTLGSRSRSAKDAGLAEVTVTFVVDLCDR